jgi:S-adenosylmethionine hydrolase
MIITLTTDFGVKDPYVGIMKGVILGIAPDVEIVDLSHEIRSYDVLDAAFVLKSSYSYFPAGTIHVGVIDPGVGSVRRAIAGLANRHYFVAPDNGVLSLVLDTESGKEPPQVHHISNERLFRTPVSRTFHGRDIFAPTAAHLARGTPLESVGASIGDFVRRAIPKLTPLGRTGVLATVLHVDKFGNIITNLRRDHLSPHFRIHVAGSEVTRLCNTFSEAPPGELVAIEGSTGFIEIALDQASAAESLNIRPGAEIKVETARVNY